MKTVEILCVGRAEMPLLHQALSALSADLGDQHRVDLAALIAAGLGPDPSFHALVAVRDGEAIGALMGTPLFSTTRGGVGLYVSDLWVAKPARGLGLGRQLLARAIALWGAGFVKLAVYSDNPQAQAFYRSLGFAPQTDEIAMVLQGDGIERLEGTT